MYGLSQTEKVFFNEFMLKANFHLEEKELQEVKHSLQIKDALYTVLLKVDEGYKPLITFSQGKYITDSLLVIVKNNVYKINLNQRVTVAVKRTEEWVADFSIDAGDNSLSHLCYCVDFIDYSEKNITIENYKLDALSFDLNKIYFSRLNAAQDALNHAYRQMRQSEKPDSRYSNLSLDPEKMLQKQIETERKIKEGIQKNKEKLQNLILKVYSDN